MDPPRLGTVLEDVAFLRQLQSNGTLPAQINALLEAFSTKVIEVDFPALPMGQPPDHAGVL
jgi:hypothetical protein